MKKITAIFVTISMFCVLLAGCDRPGNTEIVGKGECEEIDAENLFSGTLTAAFPAQFGSEDLVEHFNYYSDKEITPGELAGALSVWTGLDFFASVSVGENGKLIVDWAADSTLIANLDDREQKEEFFMFDSDSMRWFMMDSLWRTLKENLYAEVYYTMDGGKELRFEELYPVNVFDQSKPYMGSSFYFKHADDADRENSISIDDDIAFELVRNAMDGRGEEACVLVMTGEEIINGERCRIFSAGEYSDDGEKYTALYQYAVSDGWTLYYINTAEGTDWHPMAKG